jgi:hypothetical protein
MYRSRSVVGVVAFFFLSLAAFAQQSSNAPSPDSVQRGAATVRGCLQRIRGNYQVIEDQTSLVYVLKGVGNKLDGQLHKEVEVKGTVLPGTIKTGVRSQKAGSNPSDTVHGVDGLPLQVADINDVKTVDKHCKAADQQ